MKTGRKVRTAIIGAGDITRKRHLPALLQAESAQLFGICNRTPEKALKIAEEYGLHFYKTAEEVFADSSIEAVLIATPPETHRELAVAALAAGKHVLLEKPMALTTEDAEAIREAEEKSTASLMMLHVQRFYEPHKKAKELLEEGMIGRLLSCRSFLGSGKVREKEQPLAPCWQDALSNVGIHRIDLLRYLVGDEVTGVFGYCSHLLFPGEASNPAAPDDHAVGILQFGGGVVATMIASKTSFHGEDRSTVLIGTEGTIMTYALGHDVCLLKRNGEQIFFDFDSSHVQSRLELTDAHEQFCRCILEGRKMPVTVEDGLISVQILQALFRADEEHCFQEIPVF